MQARELRRDVENGALRDIFDVGDQKALWRVHGHPDVVVLSHNKLRGSISDGTVIVVTVGRRGCGVGFLNPGIKEGKVDESTGDRFDDEREERKSALGVLSGMGVEAFTEVG